MIARGSASTWEISCDQCPTTHIAEVETFYEARAEMKAKGWTTEKLGTEWINRCPACAEDTRAKGRLV